MTAATADRRRERWEPGEVAWFEYHCNEAHDSEHAEWWYRSHQQVTILTNHGFDANGPGDGTTLAERDEWCEPWCYRIRWADGFEGDVFEDELLTSPDGFYRPDPPKQP